MFDLLTRMGRALLPKPWRRAITDSLESTLGPVLGVNLLANRLNESSRMVQMLTAFIIKKEYESVTDNSGHTADINRFELKIYSQNSEDGILLYIFSQIDASNHCFVELGIGDGKECNTANLSLNFGWHGLLLDCDEGNVACAKRYYESKLGDKATNVSIVMHWITTENINKILSDNGLRGEIDLLSIDIDGNDYWVWKAINVVAPRVVVIEYNASMGCERSLTVKYDENFERHKKHPSGFYCGASLAALTKLANTKGYVLVGCDSLGTNAFFVREDIAHQKLSEVSVQNAYFPHSRRSKKLSTEGQFELIKHLDFVEI